MSDLISWLRQTIEGDKAAAEAASAGKYDDVDANGHWTADTDTGVVFAEGVRYPAVIGGSCGCCVFNSAGRDEDLRHVAIHDPQDTIARCEAELALLERLEYAMNDPINFDFAARNLAEDAIEALTSGYRHRTGFNPEWVSE